MSSNHLLREHAPITQDGWRTIDDEARARLTPGLAARRMVDFRGPHGWEYSSSNLGRVESVGSSGIERVEVSRRLVQPLLELRAGFVVSRSELAAGDRGAEDVDFADLDAAAQRLVEAENTAMFHGWPKSDEGGISQMTPHEEIAGGTFDGYPDRVARAVEVLLRAGVGGPYGLAVGREEYTRVVENTEHGGYPLLDHLRKILKGPVVWAPGVSGAIVLSMRGGDFVIDCGEDLSVGYSAHDGDTVELYLEESYSFRVLTPEAAVAIGPSEAAE
jgi:uncharacterized linocin/CFP29 family protein